MCAGEDMNKIIRYGFLENTAIGNILVGATAGGVCCVSFGRKSKDEKLNALRKKAGSSVDVVPDPEAVRPYIESLKSYLAGVQGSLDVPIDMDTFCTPFQKRLYKALLKTGFGKIISYGELAARIGMPKGARAVGGGMGKNPIPIFIPCHRVTGANGALGGFSGGIEYKKILLRIEGVFD